MKKHIYQQGQTGKKYGIWNADKKEWQFEICEDTPMLAKARLFQMLGEDANKRCFETRMLPKRKFNKIEMLVENLRIYSRYYRSGETLGRMIENTEKVIDEAANTITALMKEVPKHGHWIKMAETFLPTYQCSVCGMCNGIGNLHKGNYCSYCGAKMDEKGEKNDA